ncbi:MAG: putative RNA methyltransferase [Solirubrobacteraceae bacterium]
MLTTPSLHAVAPRLRCPNCRSSVSAGDRSLACPEGHSFDVARQGYLTLPAPGKRIARGDTASMVAARDAFLAGDHYRPIANALAEAACQHRAGLAARAAEPIVVDIGSGPGYYLASVLRALPGAWGVALDSSRPALVRAAGADRRIAAVRCDVWRELPVASGGADLAINVFAPRNGAELARVLAPEGALIVVTPTAHHLCELIAAIGLLKVDPDKGTRLDAALVAHLQRHAHQQIEFELVLDHDEVWTLVAMGPSAHHLGGDELRRRVERLPTRVLLTGSVAVDTFVRRGRANPSASRPRTTAQSASAQPAPRRSPP